MTENEFNELVKKALADDQYWNVLTATPEDREQVADWLRTAIQRVRSDRKIREARWAAESVQHRMHSPEWRRAMSSYSRWKAGALTFEQGVLARLRELGLDVNGKARKQEKPEALEKAHQHHEYMQRRLRETTDTLLTLAAAVLDFEAGDCTLRDLTSHLDDLVIPNGPGDAPIREVLDRVRQSNLEKFAAVSS